jgi:protein-tyrosine-phosphatase
MSRAFLFAGRLRVNIHGVRAGIDISDDHSKPLTPEDAKWADLVLTVREVHAVHLTEEFPQVASKVRCLGSDV